MTGFLARRTAQMAVTLAAFLVVVFFLLQLQPGDYTNIYVQDPNISPESREAIARAFGIDKPVWKQFILYLGNFFQGDFGVSFGHYPKSVLGVIGERLPRTLLLFVNAAVTSFYLGFVLGKAIAWRRGRLVEYAATVTGVYLYTVFIPWFALLMIWAFAFKLGWFPINQFITPSLWAGSGVESKDIFLRILLTAGAQATFILVLVAVLWRRGVRRLGSIALGLCAGTSLLAVLGWWLSDGGVYGMDIVKHLALPIIVLTLVSFAGTMLLTRASMVETLREDYVTAARARGLPEHVVRDRYAARNAILPVVTSLVFSLAAAIDGSVIVESVFSYPGMGLTLVESATSNDLPLAMGAFIFTGLFALAAHVVADLLYLWLDPRMRSR